MNKTVSHLNPSFCTYMHDLLQAEYEPRLASVQKSPLLSYTSVSHRYSETTHRRYQQYLEQIGGYTIRPHHTIPHHYLIDGAREKKDVRLGSTLPHQLGQIYIQETSPALPAGLIPVQPNDLVLDMCAAPGGKTIQLAAHMLANFPDQPGLVVANEINPKRAHPLAHNINRTGTYNTTITQYNGTQFGKHLPCFFDHVLLDAPCSGEGTLHKIDSPHRRNKHHIKKITNTQRSLCRSAFKTLNIGGTLTYATCTSNHRENEAIVDRILRTFGDQIELIPHQLDQYSSGITHVTNERILEDNDAAACIRCRPHLHQTGGFFVAQFRKLADHKMGHQGHMIQGNPFGLDHSHRATKPVLTYLTTHRGYQPTDAHMFVISNDVVYLASSRLRDTLPVIRSSKLGIPILEKKTTPHGHETYIPTRYLACLASNCVTTNSYQATDEEEVASYLSGDSFNPQKTLSNKQRYRLQRHDEYIGVIYIQDSIAHHPSHLP